MDVDELNDEELLSWFDLSDDAFPWRADACTAMHARRAAMGGQLFLDKLLPAAAGEPVEEELMNENASRPLFPPADADEFRRLLVALQHSPHTTTQRDSIAFYFLCAWYPRGAADPNGFTIGSDGEPYTNALDDAKLRKFAQARLIAPHYAALARAYYLLDVGVLEPAVAILSDARILPEWSSKILHTLSLPGLDVAAPLILKYVRCSKPTICDMDDVNIYLSALVKDSFMDAWLYQRSFPVGPFREQCIRRVLELCLAPQHSPAQLKLLIAYPFDPTEEATVSAYAQDPPAEIPAKSVAVLRQLLLVRLIQCGRYTDALKFDRANPVPDYDEARVKERRALMRHVMGLIPRAVREDVEREFGAPRVNGHSGGIGTPPGTPKRVPSASGSWALVSSNSDDLAASWEDLGKSTNGPPSAQRRTSYSRLEGPAAPTIGTPSKRAPGHALAADSPGRGRAYESGSLRTPTLGTISQPSTSVTAAFIGGNKGSLLRAKFNAPPSPVYQPSPAPAFSPMRPLPVLSNGSVTPSKRPPPESPHMPAVRPNQDIEMIDSDDPDAFVVRGYRPIPLLNGKKLSRDQDVDMANADEPSNGATATQEDVLALPGAFPEHPSTPAEEEADKKAAQHRSKRQRQVQSFEVPPEEPKKTATTRVRATRRTRRTSMPGELLDGDGESSELSEEEDDVPALPPSKKPAARTAAARRSRASSSESEAPQQPARRSSRLSTATTEPVAPAPAPAPAPTKKKVRGRASFDPAPPAPARKATRRSRMTLDGVEE